MIELNGMKPHQVKEYIAMIKHNAVAMLELVNHFLEGETTASCGEANIVNTRIDGYARVIAESMKPYAAQHGLEFLYDIDAPLYACCDLEMLGRVLNNLLSNAIKYTQPEGFVYLAARRSGEWLEITVSDTGCGLSEAYQDQLASMGDGERELGIGLKLVKSMMRAMGASISFTSREYVGTTFYLQFPAAEPIVAEPAVCGESAAVASAPVCCFTQS